MALRAACSGIANKRKTTHAQTRLGQTGKRAGGRAERTGTVSPPRSRRSEARIAASAGKAKAVEKMSGRA